MILAKLSDKNDYKGISPLLDKALDLLTPEFISTVTTTRTEIDGDKLYVNLCDYETVPPEESFLESHKKYLDIHVMAFGEEKMGIAHPDTLEQYEQRGDLYCYHGEPEQYVVLRPDNFLVVFPGDAHLTKVWMGERKRVGRVVFKILIED